MFFFSNYLFNLLDVCLLQVVGISLGLQASDMPQVPVLILKQKNAFFKF